MQNAEEKKKEPSGHDMTCTQNRAKTDTTVKRVSKRIFVCRTVGE